MFNHTMGIQESVKHVIYLQKEKKGYHTEHTSLILGCVWNVGTVENV
jgi:hypothetical protein